MHLTVIRAHTLSNSTLLTILLWLPAYTLYLFPNIQGSCILVHKTVITYSTCLVLAMPAANPATATDPHDPTGMNKTPGQREVGK